jgi:magnesium-protoporphyrin O-methyltransferase
MSACCGCEAIDRHFTPERAGDELAAYSRRGPTGTARLILSTLSGLPGRIESLLDIGAGIGVLHHELLARGAASAVHVEAAEAYVHAARQESIRRGQEDRVRFVHGDFLALAPSLGPADLVTLDRVVCCHPALDPLIRLSAAKARRYYALSYPHDRWYTRAHTWWENTRRVRAGNPFRTFVHPVALIHALIRDVGFQIRASRRSLVWEVILCVRPGVM